jgi:protein phosphatase
MAQFELKTGYRTDVGRQRKLNEDSLLVLTSLDLSGLTGIDGLFVVADGMGGHSAGDVASKFAVDTLRDVFSGSDYLQQELNTGNTLPEIMSNLINEINTRLYQTGIDNSMPNGMGTTVTAVCLLDTKLYIAHVGDTRAYLIRDGLISQLTRDHSWVSEQVELGLITKEQAQNHPNRNILTRAVGSDPSVKVDLYNLDIINGDSIVLCSDGLHGLVNNDEILNSTLKNPRPQQACDELIELANNRGGHDNITVIIVEFSGAQVNRKSKTDPLIPKARYLRDTAPLRVSGIKRGRKKFRILYSILTIIIIMLMSVCIFLGSQIYSLRKSTTNSTKKEAQKTIQGNKTNIDKPGK